MNLKSKGLKISLKTMAICFVSIPIGAWAQDTVTKTVDTGSHTCTSIGQEKKVYDVAESGSDRYFLEGTVRYDEVSKFRAGDCIFTNDNGGTVERRRVKLKLENGRTAEADVPVKYYLRAFGDCTNNPGNLGKSMGTECKFSAETVEYDY